MHYFYRLIMHHFRWNWA